MLRCNVRIIYNMLTSENNEIGGVVARWDPSPDILSEGAGSVEQYPVIPPANIFLLFLCAATKGLDARNSGFIPE